jgi:putative sterol carrier protein
MASREEIITELENMRTKLISEQYARHFRKWNKTMQYFFTDTEEYYNIELVDGEPQPIKEEKIDNPEISYKMTTDVFLDIMRGELGGMKAYTTGKLKIKASMPDIMKLQKLV